MRRSSPGGGDGLGRRGQGGHGTERPRGEPPRDGGREHQHHGQQRQKATAEFLQVAVQLHQIGRDDHARIGIAAHHDAPRAGRGGYAREHGHFDGQAGIPPATIRRAWGPGAGRRRSRRPRRWTAPVIGPDRFPSARRRSGIPRARCCAPKSRRQRGGQSPTPPPARCLKRAQWLRSSTRSRLPPGRGGSIPGRAG
jgi:hypothetical protein